MFQIMYLLALNGLSTLRRMKETYYLDSDFIYSMNMHKVSFIGPIPYIPLYAIFVILLAFSSH